MSLLIRNVASRSEERDFLTLPRTVYREDPYWIPQLHAEVRRALDSARNPYYRTAIVERFVAYRDGVPVARMSCVVNHRYFTPGKGYPALFGFFESMHDPEAVRMLFAAGRSWSAARGAMSLIGPFNPHHYGELGIQLDGFDTLPSFFQTHHRPYYAALLESTGCVQIHSVHTGRNPDIKRFLERRGKSSAPEHGFRVRFLNMNDLSADLDRIRQVFNAAFAPNPFFLPLSLDEYLYSAASLRYVTRPELNVIVEHSGEPVGALQCVLDINPLLLPMRSGRARPWDMARFLVRRRHLRRLIVFAVGIKPAWQRTRVHALLYNALSDMARNYDELESTWMSPDNMMALHAAERFGLTPDKHFALYETRFS